MSSALSTTLCVSIEDLRSLLRNATALAKMRDGKVQSKCTLFLDFPHATQWVDSTGHPHSSLYSSGANLAVCVPVTATVEDCALNGLPAFSRLGAARKARALVSSPVTSTVTL